jgi:tetratricopeptide (TPR) repeat protein
MNVLIICPVDPRFDYGFLHALLCDWIAMDPVLRAGVAALVIGLPAMWIFETVRHAWLVLGRRGALHLAPISVRGEMLERVTPKGVALSLRGELAAIAETHHMLASSPAPYIAPATSRAQGYYFVGMRQPHLPMVREAQEIQPIEHEIVLRVGTVTIPISQMVNLLIRLSTALYVPFRARYQRSLIHITLVSSGQQTNLVVYGPKRRATETRRPRMLSLPWLLLRRRRAAEARRSQVVLRTTRPTATLAQLNDLLRDTAFMILQLHGTFGAGQRWRSMRCLIDGVAALDEYRRTGADEARLAAKTCFRQAAEEDPVHNHHALYFHGVMTMVERTAESLEVAIQFFEQAARTEDEALLGLAHTGLAYCYAQQVHRLGKRKEEVLAIAAKHACEAERLWSAQEHPLIPYTLALVSMVNEEDADDLDGMGRTERFCRALSLLDRAIELEPENGMFYNNTGWALLKLNQWGVEELPAELQLHGTSDERRVPVLAEQYLHRSLGFNPHNKLTHANLCLLYASDYFRNVAQKSYLPRARYYGLKALELDPGYINGRRDLAVALVRYGQLDDAYRYFGEALELAEEPDKDEEIISDLVREVEQAGGDNRGLERWRNPNPAWLKPRSLLKEEPPADASEDRDSDRPAEVDSEVSAAAQPTRD